MSQMTGLESRISGDILHCIAISTDKIYTMPAVDNSPKMKLIVRTSPPLSAQVEITSMRTRKHAWHAGIYVLSYYCFIQMLSISITNAFFEFIFSSFELQSLSFLLHSLVRLYSVSC